MSVGESIIKRMEKVEELIKQNGLYDKILSAEETAETIDKIAAVPGIVWDFESSLILSKEEWRKIDDLMKEIAKAQHQTATIYFVQKPEIASGRTLEYSLKYDSVSGARVVMQGFNSGHAHLLKPEMEIYPLSHMPSGNMPSHSIPSLISVEKKPNYENRSRYVMSFNKRMFFDFRDCDSDRAVMPVIEEKVEQIIQALK
jgi:hypothetical protein